MRSDGVLELLQRHLLFERLHALARQRFVAHFHHVVGASRELLGDLCPTPGVLVVGRQEDGVLLRRPRPNVDSRVEVLAPAFLALLGVAARHQARDGTPAVGTVLVDGVSELLVFFGCPLAFHEVRSQRLAPALVALGEVAGFDQLRDGFPVLRPVGLDGGDEALVLILGPVAGAGCSCHCDRSGGVGDFWKVLLWFVFLSAFVALNSFSSR